MDFICFTEHYLELPFFFFFNVTKTLLMHELFVDISQAHPYKLQIQIMQYSLLKNKNFKK